MNRRMGFEMISRVGGQSIYRLSVFRVWDEIGASNDFFPVAKIRSDAMNKKSTYSFSRKINGFYCESASLQRRRRRKKERKRVSEGGSLQLNFFGSCRLQSGSKSTNWKRF